MTMGPTHKNIQQTSSKVVDPMAEWAMGLEPIDDDHYHCLLGASSSLAQIVHGLGAIANRLLGKVSNSSAT